MTPRRDRQASHLASYAQRVGHRHPLHVRAGPVLRSATQVLNAARRALELIQGRHKIFCNQAALRQPTEMRPMRGAPRASLFLDAHRDRKPPRKLLQIELRFGSHDAMKRRGRTVQREMRPIAIDVSSTQREYRPNQP
jgi:hypothetical protein